MMVPLRQLHERFPALCSGFSARDIEFAALARRLAAELRRLRAETVVPRIGEIFPLDFLTLFAPERRFAVVNDGVKYRDWLHAGRGRRERGSPPGRPFRRSGNYDLSSCVKRCIVRGPTGGRRWRYDD